VRYLTWRRLVALLAVVGFTMVYGSYLRALMYPGEASVSVRSVEWLRDNGGSPLVDAVEDWWFTHHAPPTTPPVPGTLPTPPVVAVPGAPGPLLPIGTHPMAGEGVWTTGLSGAHGGTPLFVTWVRPDPVHPGVFAAVARFDQNLVSARLIAGTREPDQQSWPEGGQVPQAQRGGLVATFNSGFKMSDAQGGYVADGRTARPLRDGAASLVIDRSGRVSVDQWRRDRRMGPDVAAVRQNLDLIIDNGATVPGLAANPGGRWGSTKNQLQYTWRSVLGVDAAGHLYYVAGDGLTLATLTRALEATGAVRGMELDIHPAEVHLFTYTHPVGAADPAPSALTSRMHGPRDRYLQPDQRDFIALIAR
jgi:hypothetical protein